MIPKNVFAISLSKFHLNPKRTFRVSASLQDKEKFLLPQRFGGYKRNLWNEYNFIAEQSQLKGNLVGGYPDFSPPDHVIRSLAEVASEACIPGSPLNQYTSGNGHPRLAIALAALYSKLTKRNVDPKTEVIVTAGAVEALFCAIHGIVDCGDEVIIIEPAFDCYAPMVISAGGIPQYVPLRPCVNECDTRASDWVLDVCELKCLFNSKTKMLILNTPHNPTGKVFTCAEIGLISELCKKYNVVCLADEVYEWMIFSNATPHISMATVEGMWDRTITIGSAGKTYSATGWKTGWAYGPPCLIRNLCAVHQYCVRSHNTILQEAIARALECDIARMESPECYFYSLANMCCPKRCRFVEDLKGAGFKPTIPDGGYYIFADFSTIASKLNGGKGNGKDQDIRFTQAMAKKVGVLGMPGSAFYSENNKKLGENYARFCFIKKDEHLQCAGEALKPQQAKKDKGK